MLNDSFIDTLSATQFLKSNFWLKQQGYLIKNLTHYKKLLCRLYIAVLSHSHHEDIIMSLSLYLLQN